MNPFDEYVSTLQSAHMEVEFFKFQKAFHTHSRIIILGNGGSNSVASHISQDYMKFHGKRVSILSDPSMITMLSNDFGYDKAYEKFLEYYVEKESLVIIICEFRFNLINSDICFGEKFSKLSSFPVPALLINPLIGFSFI